MFLWKPEWKENGLCLCPPLELEVSSSRGHLFFLTPSRFEIHDYVCQILGWCEPLRYSNSLISCWICIGRRTEGCVASVSRGLEATSKDWKGRYKHKHKNSIKSYAILLIVGSGQIKNQYTSQNTFVFLITDCTVYKSILHSSSTPATLYRPQLFSHSHSHNQPLLTLTFSFLSYSGCNCNSSQV